MATGSIARPLSYAVFEEVSASLYTGETIAANSNINGTKDLTKLGYYPIALAGWSAGGSNSGFVCPGRMYMSAKSEGACTITYNFQNTSSSALSGQSFSVRVLWMKI